MSIISMLLSLPVSIILIRWLMKKKQETGRPFEKGNVRRLVIAGMISVVVASVVTIAISAIKGLLLIGPDTLNAMIHSQSEEELQQVIASNGLNSGYSAGKVFLNTLLAVGIVEELSRFLFLRIAAWKKPFAKTWMDLVICGGIVGTGFQLLEDLMYSSGGLLLSVMRALMPFHFLYGVLMGYFAGKAAATGKKSNYILSILVPVALHTLFDASINAMQQEDAFIFLLLIMLVLNLVLTIVMIVKISRWSRSGKLEQDLLY